MHLFGVNIFLDVEGSPSWGTLFIGLLIFSILMFNVNKEMVVNFNNSQNYSIYKRYCHASLIRMFIVVLPISTNIQQIDKNGC